MDWLQHHEWDERAVDYHSCGMLGARERKNQRCFQGKATLVQFLKKYLNVLALCWCKLIDADDEHSFIDVTS